MSERRRHERIRENTLVRFRLEDEATYQFGLCLDLSEGGLRLITERESIQAQNLILSGHFADQESVYTFSASAEIVWQRNTHENRVMIGLRFTEISTEDYQNLQRYILGRQAIQVA